MKLSATILFLLNLEIYLKYAICGIVSQFQFVRKDCQTTLVLPDSSPLESVGDLISNSVLFICPLSNGLMSSVSSASNASRLINSLSNDSIAIELWIQFDSTNPGDETVVAVSVSDTQFNIKVTPSLDSNCLQSFMRVPLQVMKTFSKVNKYGNHVNITCTVLC